MIQKNRTAKAKNVRALRRSLAEITPEDSIPQLQSPLFGLLPSEVRNLIFEYAVSQTVVSRTSELESSCGDLQPGNELRPGHELQPILDTALLRTCRLIYYETRAIPLRSATHHVDGDIAGSYDQRDWDHYLFHLSSQSGQNLHHLHVTSWKRPKFYNHLQQHLHWRKITWTICALTWVISDGGRITEALRETKFPNSCREVNLEFETLKEASITRRYLRPDANRHRDVQLTRYDGSKMELDEDYSMEYTWEGRTWRPPRRDEIDTGRYVPATYHVIRLCWREKVPERNYMHYDHWDCLRSDRIKPVPLDYNSDDEEGS